MTNEEIRIKVAKSLGWEGIRGETGYPTPRARELGDYQAIPNYPESLDACAEFEATLTLEESTIYVNLLWPQGYAPFALITAKPLQRCLAYLKTKGIIQ